jgi:hypothetical protein
MVVVGKLTSNSEPTLPKTTSLVEFGEEVENIGSLSTYVKYSNVKYYLIICARKPPCIY